MSLGIDTGTTATHILQQLGFVVSFEIERDIDVYDLSGATIRFERYARMDTLVEVEGAPNAIERAVEALGIPRAEFTTGRLADFARAFEDRTGDRAALSAAELIASDPYERADA